MPPKELLCKKCGNMHKRPINSKCQFTDSQTEVLDSHNDQLATSSGVTSQSADNELNMQILAELKNLGGRMTAMEHRMAETDQLEVTQRSKSTREASIAPTVSSTAQLEQTVVPSIPALQGAAHIQAEVDRRIRHLTELNESGKLKSQRGGHDTVFVKKQVPWPQNFVLGGSNKSRVSYDSLSWCQWVSGFAMIAKEEQNIETKNAMLDYLTELMDDANDFSWQSAKAAHAVLLCRMEEGKIEWSETSKIDRVRRAHAQRLPSQSLATGNKTKFDIKPFSDTKSAVCRFFQRGMCQKDRDHETGGTFYRHICATCYTMGKEHRHMAKDCRVSARSTKNE